VTSGQGPASAGPVWTAEIVVTPEFAASLISEQFPELRGTPVTLLETGWDNTAFVVDRQWLFRFPRRQIALPGVRREIEVLPRLAPRLPLPIPEPVFVGQPTERYGWPFFGARLLPGRELAVSGLSDADRGAAAAAVGGFLRALHDPALVPLVDGAGLPADPMRRASPPARARMARAALAMLARRGLRPASSEISRLLDRAEAEASAAGPSRPGGPPGLATAAASPVTASNFDAPADGPLIVSHGDLHVRHLLVEDGAATGVIDWGDLCLADPAVDLSVAYFGFAGKARADLVSAYGEALSAERELAARACAISLAVSLAEYAADDGRVALLRECLAGLGRTMAA
jgi:aminoglycoside phosphotransferase (APT) family kinase protein